MSEIVIPIDVRLSDAISHARRSFYRLVLFVATSGSGKTQILRQLAASHACQYLNVNRLLSQRLLEIPRTKRPRQVDRIFNSLLDEHRADLLILDNLEILFDPALQLDPLRLLKAASRRQTLVAAWNGTTHEGGLSYAEPDHSEYRSYRTVDVTVVPLVPESTASH